MHHVVPRCHWTEHPAEFERNLAEYGRNDAVVLAGVDFFQVWFLLMTGNWARLARAFVRLPGAPARTDAEVMPSSGPSSFPSTGAPARAPVTAPAA